MKTFLKIIFVIVLGIFLNSGYCLAGTSVIFEWTANTEPHLDGYRLYQTATSGEYTFDEGNIIVTIPAGTETHTLPNVSDGTWYWVLTAFSVAKDGMEGFESGPSNEVTITLDTVIPDDPNQLRIQSACFKKDQTI